MSVPTLSPRVQLARLALETAVAHPDVTGASVGSGGLPVTEAHDLRLEGVSATAESAGSYAVWLRLSARFVPLRPLAEELRERIATAAERMDSAGAVGAVDIEFAAIETGGEG